MKLLLDENFRGEVLRGLLRLYPELHYIRAQDTSELYSQPDAKLLEWAAAHDFVVLSGDYRTLRPEAYKRVEAGLAMPGVIICPRTLSIGETIQELSLIIGASEPDEFRDLVVFLPLG